MSMAWFGKPSDRKILLMRRDSADSISWSGISLDSRHNPTEDNAMILFDLESMLSGGGSEIVEDSGPFVPTAAVSTVFEQVRPIQESLAQVGSILEPMQQLSELTNLFEPLREFELQIKELAKVLEPMQNLQDRLRPVLQQFTPLKGLDQELNQLSAAFGESLSQLAAALEPAAKLPDQLTQLAAQFKPAETLLEEFSALAESFGRSSRCSKVARLA
jgi:chaperonin cofactor prefoldin